MNATAETTRETLARLLHDEGFSGVLYALKALAIDQAEGNHWLGFIKSLESAQAKAEKLES